MFRNKENKLVVALHTVPYPSIHILNSGQIIRIISILTGVQDISQVLAKNISRELFDADCRICIDK